MDSLLTPIVSVLSLILGTWLGSHLSLRNTLKALEIQNEQKQRERKEQREAKEKEEVRDWFEKYAIDECVDPLLAEVLSLQEFLYPKPV